MAGISFTHRGANTGWQPVDLRHTVFQMPVYLDLGKPQYHPPLQIDTAGELQGSTGLWLASSFLFLLGALFTKGCCEITRPGFTYPQAMQKAYNCQDLRTLLTKSKFQANGSGSRSSSLMRSMHRCRSFSDIHHIRFALGSSASC